MKEEELEELRERGYENPEEVLRQIEEGRQQIKDGKGMTTEELKAKLLKRWEKTNKHKKSLDK